MIELRKYNCGNDGCNKNFNIALGLEMKVEELKAKLMERNRNSIDKMEMIKRLTTAINNLEKLLDGTQGNPELSNFYTGKAEGLKQIKDLINNWL